MRAPATLSLYVTIAASLQVRLFDVWGVASPPDLVLVPLLLPVPASPCVSCSNWMVVCLHP